MIIATHALQNYPHTSKIFADMGHELINLSSRKQIAKTPFDALILLGGPDVHPSLYDEETKYPGSRSNWQRDNLEWQLIRKAYGLKIPILGTCRGMQLINVTFKGTLWQDLKRDKIGEVDHRSYHNIMIDGKSPLAGLIPLHVNSRHHQAVNKVAPGFKPIAWSFDGVIEAIYCPGILGVQWHPEDLYFEDVKWTNLFKWFISGLRS